MSLSANYVTVSAYPAVNSMKNTVFCILLDIVLYISSRQTISRQPLFPRETDANV